MMNASSVAVGATGVDVGAKTGDADDGVRFAFPIIIISARLVKHALRICGFKHVLHLPHFWLARISGKFNFFFAFFCSMSFPPMLFVLFGRFFILIALSCSFSTDLRFKYERKMSLLNGVSGGVGSRLMAMDIVFAGRFFFGLPSLGALLAITAALFSGCNKGLGKSNSVNSCPVEATGTTGQIHLGNSRGYPVRRSHARTHRTW